MQDIFEIKISVPHRIMETALQSSEKVSNTFLNLGWHLFDLFDYFFKCVVGVAVLKMTAAFCRQLNTEPSAKKIQEPVISEKYCKSPKTADL